ncbi:MAG: ATP-binding protein [Elusimicrobiota bacterium]|jgi:signal transduction histidine kinase
MPGDNARRPVLVVYGQAADLPFIGRILEKDGVPAETARSAAEARRLLAEKSYPVLFVDSTLPESDCVRIFREAQLRDPHAVCVALTPISTQEGAVEALQQGAYDCVAMPCPPELLAAAATRALERYELNTRSLEQGHETESLRRDLDHRVQEATQEIHRSNERLNRRIRRLGEDLAHQSRFLEDMVHELKNPLAVILGYSTFLLRRPIEEWAAEDITRSLESVHRNAEHLQALIEEILDSTRLAERKIGLRCETFLASEAVRETVEGLQVQAAERGLTLDMDLPSPKSSIYADRNRLRQILINLVSNALKFTPKGGRITVQARPEKEEMLFCVSDTGKGIEKKDLEKVFERFYQVHETRQMHKGLGLGLNIVKGLVELHGGRIWAESEPGKGARFYFTLPSTLTVPNAEAALSEDGSANPS